MQPDYIKRKVSDPEYRLRLLLCVHCLGMVTREQLWPFVAQLELMEYVPMCLFVDELLRDGSLAEGVHATEGVLFVTDAGQKTLRLFMRNLPQSDRERIVKAAPDYCAVLEERRQVQVRHELAPTGRYSTLATVVEGDLPTLTLRLMTAERKAADTLMKRFRANASKTLGTLYTLPQPDKLPAPAFAEAAEVNTALEQVEPGKPMLCSFGKHEHAAVICLKDELSEYRIALLMPSREAAEKWAAAAGIGQNELLAHLRELLEGKKRK